jgi:hypothetical protein
MHSHSISLLIQYQVKRETNLDSSTELHFASSRGLERKAQVGAEKLLDATAGTRMVAPMLDSFGEAG